VWKWGELGAVEVTGKGEGGERAAEGSPADRDGPQPRALLSFESNRDFSLALRKFLFLQTYSVEKQWTLVSNAS
jgi:hypothetical protein